MQKIGFAEALDSIVASDPRYQRDAYVFLRDALDYTTKQQKKAQRRGRPPRRRSGVARRRASVCAEGIRTDGR